MIQRKSRILVAAFVLVVLAAVAGVAVAEEAREPFTYVAEWTIARDQWSGYAEWIAKNHKPVLDRLAADGTLVDWGIYETYVHTEGENTHGIWWTATSFAGIEKARVELLKVPMHPAAAAGAHHDYLLRAIEGKSRSATVAGGFLTVNTNEVRAGHEKEWKESFDTYYKPVLDELVAKGTLVSWALHAEDIHTGPRGLRFLVSVSPSAAAEDEIEAAFTAADAKRGEAQGQLLRNLARESTVMESHRDYLARVSAGWSK